MARDVIDLTGNQVKADEFVGALGATVSTELESAGAGITIPAGSTLEEALQIIIDEVDPAG
jgi:hypothetical protein